MTHDPIDQDLYALIESGELFDELCDAWRRLGRLVWDSHAGATSLFNKAEGLRYMTRYLAAGAVLAMELADPDYPQFGRWAERTYTWGINNPDTIYSFAAVNGNATYRIYGNRGTAHHFDLQVHAPHFCEAPDYEIVANLDTSQLEVSSDGEVEIFVSPSEHTRNWVKTHPGVGSLCIRQYFNDWESERPAKLTIERVGASYPPPADSVSAIAERTRMLIRWLDKAGSFWDAMCKACLDAEPNTVRFLDPGLSEWGGLRGLAYGLGNFRCESDQAVIMEVVPPQCHYWSYQLGTWYWESMDWYRRQTSLNGHYAHLDSDGAFRAVIAHEDPGVANWLDPAGQTWGTLNGRWLLTESLPEPELKVVPIGDVMLHLPDDTVTVTPKERSESIRRRQRLAHLRDGF